MIVENGNVKYMNLKELRKILETQKDPKMVVEKGTEKLFQFSRSNLEVKNWKKRRYFTIYICI